MSIPLVFCRSSRWQSWIFQFLNVSSHFDRKTVFLTIVKLYICSKYGFPFVFLLFTHHKLPLRLWIKSTSPLDLPKAMGIHFRHPHAGLRLVETLKLQGKLCFLLYFKFYYSKENSFSVKMTRNIQKLGNPRMPSKRATKNMLDRGITFDFPIWEGKNTPNPPQQDPDEQALLADQMPSRSNFSKF